MNKELRYKNALSAVLYISIFATICVALCCVFGIIMTYFFENVRDFTNVAIIGSSIVGAIWFMAIVVIFFNGSVIITSEEIKLCRGKHVKWIMLKSDFTECVYHRMHWYDFIMPISAINVYQLQFRVTGKVFSKNHCSLSWKQVKEIQETFDYPIRIIDTVYER